jgi:hypothetical protein
MMMIPQPLSDLVEMALKVLSPGPVDYDTYHPPLAFLGRSMASHDGTNDEDQRYPHATQFPIRARIIPANMTT